MDRPVRSLESVQSQHIGVPKVVSGKISTSILKNIQNERSGVMGLIATYCSPEESPDRLKTTRKCLPDTFLGLKPPKKSKPFPPETAIL